MKRLCKPNLSVIIPAFNESRRLPGYLVPIRPYLDSAFDGRYELIVVDDGSQDGSQLVFEHLAAGWPQLSYLRHSENQGKGVAVRTGLMAARGDLLLVADADGATPIEEERPLRMAIEQGADISVGSRLGHQSAAWAHRLWYRSLCGLGFAWVVRHTLLLPIRDTQCGFKMYRKDVAKRLVYLCTEPGYLFDVEALCWAHRLCYRIVEVPVRWTDVPGSKVRIVRDGWAMLKGLFRLRRSMQACNERSAIVTALATARANALSHSIPNRAFVRPQV